MVWEQHLAGRQGNVVLVEIYRMDTPVYSDKGIVKWMAVLDIGFRDLREFEINGVWHLEMS